MTRSSYVLTQYVENLMKNKRDGYLFGKEAPEEANRLVEFFDLLFEIDEQNNPEKYRKDKQEGLYILIMSMT